jgi:hypothetical protein
MSVDETIWSIFTYYSIRGANSKHPEALDSRHFGQMIRDCGLLEGKKRLVKADLAIIIRKWAKKDKHTLHFGPFLNALKEIGLRCYPEALTAEAAFHKLLCEAVLPKALRRSPQPITEILLAVEEVLEHYRPASTQVFHFYSRIISDRRAVVYDKTNRGHLSIGYDEWCRFASDFKLPAILSTLDLAEVYLSSQHSARWGNHCATRGLGSTSELGLLEFKQFEEALLRSALAAYQSRPNVTPKDKLYALFQRLWRGVHERPNDPTHGVTEYAVRLKVETRQLDRLFRERWIADGHREYLVPSASADASQTVQGIQSALKSTQQALTDGSKVKSRELLKSSSPRRQHNEAADGIFDFVQGRSSSLPMEQLDQVPVLSFQCAVWSLFNAHVCLLRTSLTWFIAAV